MKLFLSSADSVNKFPGNRADDFRVYLPKPLSLRGRYTVTLTELTLPTFDHGGLLICSDICQNSFVGERESPLLRRIPPGLNGGEFVNHYEIPLRIQQFQVIHVYLKGSDGLPLFIPEGKTILTLVIKRATFEP